MHIISFPFQVRGEGEVVFSFSFDAQNRNPGVVQQRFLYPFKSARKIGRTNFDDNKSDNVFLSAAFR